SQLHETSPVFGWAGGKGWEWINLGFLTGGLWLLARGTIRWQIPTGLLAGLGLTALPFWLINPEVYASPLLHIVSGGALLGAFFIATDPVSASTTPRGRLLYGLGIGVLTWIIRTWGGYPDAIAFAVLLMNMAAPTIDELTQPRVYGHGRKGRHR
ncbi:MAG: RnfABCDGE type electron transport complex subunit D, partial [Nevskiales bacterium]